MSSIDGDGRGQGHGLVLTRRVGETVVVETPDGERLHVTVADIEGGQVKLRFVGSKAHFAVHRLEVQVRRDRGDLGHGA